jgi:putative FmdB family regulatory protein
MICDRQTCSQFQVPAFKFQALRCYNPAVPLYEYECKQCAHRFERIQKFSDEPVKDCPKCGGEVERLLHAPAVQFKGSGWYVTDYKKGGSGAGKGGKGDTSASADDSAKPAKPKEDKPASKPDKS